MRTQLDEQQIAALQEKILRGHWMPDTEQFGYLEYTASYTIEGVKYLFHNWGLMGVSVYRLEDK